MNGKNQTQSKYVVFSEKEYLDYHFVYERIRVCEQIVNCSARSTQSNEWEIELDFQIETNKLSFLWHLIWPKSDV